MATTTVRVKDILEKEGEAPRAVSEKIEQIAADAKLLLGYNMLADRVLNPMKLATALKQLDIQPYKLETVNRYKEEKLAEIQEARRKEKADKKASSGFHSYSRRETVGWRLINIADYDKAIPEFALRKAIQIKRLCPDAVIQIDEIRVSVRRVRHPAPRDFDPFLVVRLGQQERFYIDVWDESKFETKLF